MNVITTKIGIKYMHACTCWCIIWIVRTFDGYTGFQRGFQSISCRRGRPTIESIAPCQTHDTSSDLNLNVYHPAAWLSQFNWIVAHKKGIKCHTLFLSVVNKTTSEQHIKTRRNKMFFVHATIPIARSFEPPDDRKSALSRIKSEFKLHE